MFFHPRGVSDSFASVARPPRRRARGTAAHFFTSRFARPMKAPLATLGAGPVRTVRPNVGGKCPGRCRNVVEHKRRSSQRRGWRISGPSIFPRPAQVLEGHRSVRPIGRKRRSRAGRPMRLEKSHRATIHNFTNDSCKWSSRLCWRPCFATARKQTPPINFSGLHRFCCARKCAPSRNWL